MKTVCTSMFMYRVALMTSGMTLLFTYLTSRKFAHFENEINLHVPPLLFLLQGRYQLHATLFLRFKGPETTIRAILNWKQNLISQNAIDYQQHILNENIESSTICNTGATSNQSWYSSTEVHGTLVPVTCIPGKTSLWTVTSWSSASTTGST